MEFMSRRFVGILGLVFLASLPVLGQDYGNGGDYGSSSSDGGFRSSGRSAFGSRSSMSSRSSNSSSNRYDSSSGNGSDSSNRSMQMRDRQRYGNSNRSGSRNGKTPTPAPGSTAAGGKQVSIKGKTPAPKKSSGGTGSAGSAHGSTSVQFTMKANPNTNLLCVEAVSQTPTMNITAAQGKSFVTSVAFRNPRHSRFDSVDVSLKYDPELLRPLGVDDSVVSSMLTQPALARVDARKGIISYHAKFNEARADELLTIFKLEWKAKSPTDHTQIALINTEKNPSRVLNDDNNVLLPVDEDQQLEYSDGAGLLGADVAIVPDSTTLKRIDDADEVTGIQLANSINQGTAKGNVTLALRSNKASVATGEEFLVNIVYTNPKRSDIDLVKLKICFDPKVLQVVDDDENNWDSRGVNIFDGDFHEDLPFDFHMRNVAYNSTGEIFYENGFSDRVRIPSSGTIATIRFRALKATPSTQVALELSEDDKTSPSTISFLGFNLIGTPGKRSAAITNASLNID